MKKQIGLPSKYKSFKEYYLNESSLSRLYYKMREYDCGIISAFRDARDCGEGDLYTRKENLQRNAKLLAELQSRGFPSTRVIGGFIENFGSDESRLPSSGETSMFVYDVKNMGKIKDTLIELGIENDQDCVLIIPKDESAYLISTNKCPKAFPGFGKIGVTQELGVIHYGKESEFFTKIKNRPFFFEAVENTDYNLPSTWMGKFACHSVVKNDNVKIPINWKEIEEIDDNWTRIING